MPSPVDYQWEFTIGDFVIRKVDLINLDQMARKDPTNTPRWPLIYMVVGRQAEECVGGWQYHYRIRGFGASQGVSETAYNYLVGDFEIKKAV